MQFAARRPLLAGMAGALLIAFSAIFVRLADVSPVTAAVFRCVYALPVLAVLATRERTRLGPRSRASRRYAALAGVCFAVDLVSWHYAIDAVGAGLATVLANTQVVVVGLAAWLLLGERPARRALLAVPIVLGGVVLISGVVGAGAFGDDPRAGVAFASVTAFAYAGFLLLLRQASAGETGSARPAGPLCDATLVAAVVAALAGALTGRLDVEPTWPAHGWLILLALGSQVVAWLLITVSLPRLPALVTSVLLLLQPVGSVGLGIVLLAEAPSPLQLVGVAAVLVGVGLATARRRQVPALASPHASR